MNIKINYKPVLTEEQKIKAFKELHSENWATSEAFAKRCMRIAANEPQAVESVVITIKDNCMSLRTSRDTTDITFTPEQIRQIQAIKGV